MMGTPFVPRLPIAVAGRVHWRANRDFCRAFLWNKTFHDDQLFSDSGLHLVARRSAAWGFQTVPVRTRHPPLYAAPTTGMRAAEPQAASPEAGRKTGRDEESGGRRARKVSAQGGPTSLLQHVADGPVQNGQLGHQK